MKRVPTGARAILIVTIPLTLLTFVWTPAYAGTAAPAAGGVRSTDVIGEPSSGALLGAYAQPGGNGSVDDVEAAVGGLETSIGRTLGIDHHFYPWTKVFPTWQEGWDNDNGRLPMDSWAGESSSAINSGSQDSLIRARADALKALGFPVLVRWFGEMDGDYWKSTVGSASAFISAWKHIHDIFVQEGATNVGWVWCPNASGFKSGTAQTFYPGDGYVDWICADGYNWSPLTPGGSSGGTWTDFSDIYSAFYAWAAPKGKPLMVGETGAQEDPNISGRKGQWITDMGTSLEQDYPAIEALVYFDAVGDSNQGGTFDWTLTSSASAMNAFKGLAQDPYFGTPDTEPPSNLQATAPNSGEVDLTWTGSTDDVGVTGYDVYRNGTFLTTAPPATTYADRTVAANTTYTYSLKARDAAGNISGPSNDAVVLTPSAPATFFSDGFESGNLSNWTSSKGLIVQSADVYSGSDAARGTTTGSSTEFASKTLTSTYPDLYYRVRFKVASMGTGSTLNLERLQTAAGTNVLTLFVSSSKNLLFRNDVTATNRWGSTVVSLGVWHEVQLHVTINGSSGLVEVWLDGVKLADLSSTQSLGTAAIGKLILGDNVSGRTYDVLYDDVAASTSFISQPPDTTPPTAPSNLQATAPNSGEVDLTWTGSTDDVGVTGYDVYRNGTFLTTAPPATTYADRTVAANTTYTYSLKARDAAGNISGPSNDAVVLTPSAPATFFSDGFESGNLSNWTSSKGLIVQSADVYSGSDAARGTTTGSSTEFASKTLTSTYPDLYYRVRFKVASMGTGSTLNLERLQTAAGTNVLTLFVSSSKNLLFRNDVTATNRWGSTVVSLGVWHEVQLHVTINGSSGLVEVWLDGVKLADLSSTQSLGTAAIGKLILGDNVSGRTYDVLYDDVAASTSFIS